MRGVEWRLLDDRSTEEFRARPRPKRWGFYDPKEALEHIFTIEKISEVVDRDDDVHRIDPGTQIKVLDESDVENHTDSDWILFAREVFVRYGRSVESLRAGTPLVVLPDSESKT
tara:strand:+ start:285 stop:626 length:342 start_codon:yes stop_codon:yes gene_type:complete